MSYDNPRDRLELFLKKIIDKSTAPTERRTRFELFIAGILDGSLVPDDPRDRLELYLKGIAESGAYNPPSGTITITLNGVYNVEGKQYADVMVPAEVTGTVTVDFSATGGTPIIWIANRAADANDREKVSWETRFANSSTYTGFEIPQVQTLDVLYDGFYMFIPDSYSISGKNNCVYWKVSTGAIDLPGVPDDSDCYYVLPSDINITINLQNDEE